MVRPAPCTTGHLDANPLEIDSRAWQGRLRFHQIGRLQDHGNPLVDISHLLERWEDGGGLADSWAVPTSRPGR